jgi:hypothetical protein
MMALAARDAHVFSYEGLLYRSICVALSLLAFAAFRLHHGVSRFFSVNDAWGGLRTVGAAELMTCIPLFTLTRLDNFRAPYQLSALGSLWCTQLLAYVGDSRGARIRQSAPRRPRV